MIYSKKILNLVNFKVLEHSVNDKECLNGKKLSVSAEFNSPKIIEHKDGYYLDRSLFRKNIIDNQCKYFDLFESEWENNEIFLLESTNDFKILLWKSIKIVNNIEATLKKNFKKIEFHIVIILNEYDTEPSVSIRLYKFRENQTDLSKLVKNTEELIIFRRIIT